MANIAHRADITRSAFGLDGSGVTVGVLSNGMDSLSEAQLSHDLPNNVVILPGREGFGNAGTAMLEIVHDLAPGADLVFSTAFWSQEQMATNIRDLVDAGCDIIVDDVSYFTEPVFQDGIVAQTVADVVGNNGVVYFAAIGNKGNLNDSTASVWEGDFVDSGSGFELPHDGNGKVGTGILHDFSPNGGVDSTNNVLASSPFPTVLQWADSFGGSDNDYDLCIINNNGEVECSIDIQDGDDDPIEILRPLKAGDKVLIINVDGLADKRFLHLDTFGSGTFRSGVVEQVLEYTTNGAIGGHAGAIDVIAVAAVNVIKANVSGESGVFDEGDFPGDDDVELFSSDGPRRVFFNADGIPFTPGDLTSTGGLVRQKPDVAATDGVSTATPGFETFFGTSAAAPHAAGIAALMLDGDPTLTPGQLKGAMFGAGLDIEATGFDENAGFGLINAFDAVDGPPLPLKVPVPEIRGLLQNDGVTAIVGSGLATGKFIRKEYNPFVPAGEVITQWPAPGTMVDLGSVVEMTVSRGPAPDAKEAKVNLNGQGILSGELGAKGVPFGDLLPLVINYGQPMANVRVSIDGQSIPFEANPLDTSLLGWWLNLSGLQVGEHDLVIEAFDGLGTTVSTFQSSIFVQEIKADVRLNGRRIGTGLGGSKGVPFGDPLPVLIDYEQDVANVRVSIDGQSIPFEANPLGGSLKNWWLNLSGLTVGDHDVLIEAFDGQGQKVSTFESPIAILDVESTVRIGGIQIASGEFGGKGVPFGTLVPVVIDYAQPVANVRISVDGGIPVEATPFGLDLIGWWLNLNELSVGDHNIKIEAFDGTGKSLSIFESQIFVEEVGSEVRINDRLISSGLGGNKGVPFSDPMQVVVEYDHPVSNVRVSLDGQGIPFEASPVTSGDLTKWFINLSGVEVGNHELVIEAISSGGRTVSRFESPLVVQEFESEVMFNGRKIASGLDGNKGISFSDPLQVVVNYAGAAANVRVSIDGEMPFELTPLGTDLKQWFVNLSGVEVGEHRVVIEAFDSLGRKLAVFESPVFVQQIESQVTINGQEIAACMDGNKGVSSGDVIPIVVDYAQPVANVRIRVDGWPVIEAEPVGSDLQRFFVNWNSLPTGNHRVEIEAFDGEGKKVSAYESAIWVFP